MPLEIIIVLIVVCAAIVLFATEIFPVDLIALMILATLVITGVISPEEGVAGFSNEATVTVAAMFILSAGLYKTGAVNKLSIFTGKMFRQNMYVAIVVMMAIAGVTSAFINNTAVVALFIPVLFKVASETKKPVSKMLIPLSYAAMFGGVCTLIGTSTNLLVSSIATQYEQPAFGLFETTPMGLVFFGAGILYMIIIGMKILPGTSNEEDLTEKFNLHEYLTEIRILQGPNANVKLYNMPLLKELDLDVIQIFREGQDIYLPSRNITIQEGDVLKVRCDKNKVQELQEKEGIKLRSSKHRGKEDEKKDMHLVEVVIPPNSELEGKTIKQVHFRQRYNATALAIRHRGEIMREKLTGTEIKAGDTLLLEIRDDCLNHLKQLSTRSKNPFIIISEKSSAEFRENKMPIAIMIMAGVIITANFNILPIMVAAIAGIILMVLTRCLNMSEAYNAIDWKVIFLLAGALSLGVALKTSGAAELLSGQLVYYAGAYGPVTILAALYIITSILTETMSNNASAVLLAPIAITTAFAMDVDPRPFLMAITFAASASFMTPVGYQTNTMVYGAGNYHFKDFLKIGTPLNIIFWILAIIFIPIFYPF